MRVFLDDGVGTATSLVENVAAMLRKTPQLTHVHVTVRFSPEFEVDILLTVVPTSPAPEPDPE